MLEFGERYRGLARSELVACEAEAQAQDLCFLYTGVSQDYCSRETGGGWEHTSLACSLVNALGLVAGVGSVVVVVVVKVEESKRELVSTLGELDRVLYTTSSAL